VDADAVREARRIIAAMIHDGQALLKGGRILAPKDEVLVMVIERVAAKRLEEPEKSVEVTGFEPAGTYHTAPKPQLEEPADEAEADPLP